VRAKSSEELHALGGRLFNLSRTQDLSSRQEWLWDALQSELQYRRRRGLPGRFCVCALCVGPFVDDLEPADPSEEFFD